MTITKRLSALLEDAKDAGYEVKEDANGIQISKLVGRWKKVEGLRIYEDGVAFELSVMLDIAKGIRSYKTMRSILGLEEEK